MNIMNIMTLGLLPLFKFMFSKGEDDPRRYAAAVAYFSRWGNPPKNKLMKVLKKFYSDPTELKGAFDLLTADCHVYVFDEAEGEDFIEALENAGFEIESWHTSELPNDVYWTGTRYSTIQTLNFCNGCGRKGVRLYNEISGYQCSSCGSQNVIKAGDLSLKEFKKHVKAFPTLEPGGSKGNKRAASGGSTRSRPRHEDDEYDD